MKLVVAVAAFATSSITFAQAPAVSDPLPKLVPEITRAEIEAHVKFLASDELRGRATGSPESLRAARYLARVLEAYGVQPAGDEGFLQRVTLERTRTSAPSELVIAAKDGSTWKAAEGVDFDGGSREASMSHPLRVVVVKDAAGLPAKADAEVALFVDLSSSESRKLFEQVGAERASGWGLRLEAGPEQAGKARERDAKEWSGAQRPRARGGEARPLRARGELLARLRKGEVATIQLETHVEREPVEACNVVGILRGAGTAENSALAAEAVVVSAHYDHLGVAAPKANETQDADHIYNGADDDASGCAAVLEIAGKLAATKPARTLVFLLDTGEELGLLGIAEYLERPVVPLEKTVADVNFEMIGRPDERVGGKGKLWLTGDERSNFGEALRAAGIAVVPDPYPDEHFFERSDNIAFVQRGIVGQSLSSYAHGRHADYHEVGDSWDKLDYEHMEAAVRAGSDAVELVASGKLNLAWVKGKEPSTRGRRSAR